MKARTATISFVLLATIGCVPPDVAPQWMPSTSALEAEYVPFFGSGTGSLVGQAFIRQNGGGVVKAAGKTVTLDPATTIGKEWAEKAGTKWESRSFTPPSQGFTKARRSTVADAEGRFHFSDLPKGKYIVRTEVTWMVPYWPDQGGALLFYVDIRDGQSEIIMSN